MRACSPQTQPQRQPGTQVPVHPPAKYKAKRTQPKSPQHHGTSCQYVAQSVLTPWGTNSAAATVSILPLMRHPSARVRNRVASQTIHAVCLSGLPAGSHSTTVPAHAGPRMSTSESEVCAAFVEHVLLVVDEEHPIAQVAAPAVLGAVDLLIQGKANITSLLLVGLQDMTASDSGPATRHERIERW